MKSEILVLATILSVFLVSVGVYASHDRAVVNVSVDLEGANTPASATTFTASLNGSQEVPSVTVDGTGTGAFVLDREGLHYRITVNELTGDMTAAHFHNASAGASGGVVRTIPFDGTSASGVWRSTDAEPLTAEMINEIVSGNIYVNVHTAANPPREIRGQVTLASGAGLWASLDGDQEVPSVSVDGKGTATFVLDSDGLHYWLSVDGLTGAITGAHFHNAPAGESGGVVRGITDSFSGTTATGTWSATDSEPLSPDMIDEILAGNIYLNVHTAENPPGEIRGQVILISGARMVAALDEAQENHTVTGDTEGSGTGAFAWDGSGLSYQITVSGLTGPMTAAHFHNASAGEDGGVVRTITFDGTTATGVWRDSDAEPLTPEMIVELLAGRIYANVHTAENPAGEIRGQVNISPGIGLQAALDGSQETPSVDVDGRGTGAFTWDEDGLHYWVTVDDLTGAITGAHFHNAPSGQSGGVVHGITETFSGNTASGVWSISDPAFYGELWAGNLYVNVHTAANAPGEVRGQVKLPVSGAGGRTVAFSRSISGRKKDFLWKATTDIAGSASIEITAETEGVFRSSGANGYYVARLSEPTGKILEQWGSIPIKGGRMLDLSLRAGQRAAIAGPVFGTPLEAAGKPASGPSTVTVLSGIQPLAPIASLGSVEINEKGTIGMPIQILGANHLYAGDFTLTFDPHLVHFRSGEINGTELGFSEQSPGRVSISFHGLTASDKAEIRLFFDRLSGDDRLGRVHLAGLFIDTEFMPISFVNIAARFDRNLPTTHVLYPNYPNPFNPATQIRYDLPEAEKVRLTIYNSLGQEIGRLVDSRQAAGSYSVTWDAEGFASGLYHYKLEAGSFDVVRKMVLLK